MKYERSIRLAYDKTTGELIDADDAFEETKNAFDVRKQFSENELDLYCCECDQRLNISSSKLDRVHFKHSINSGFCELKDGQLSAEEASIHKKILISKESARHKELKKKIAERLLKVGGINHETISIDNKFIIRGGEKRKPDVYCEYYDRKIVFEIQLSDLSLRYILSRYNFYKQHGIYLVWILDNFDIHGQGQLEKDIKYLTQYQNFFKLDEEIEDFRLLCDYKFPFITEENKILTKWLQKSVSFNDIKFSVQHYQIYYFNYGENLSRREEEKLIHEKKQQEIERKHIEEQRRENAEYTAQKIIDEIKYRRTKQSSLFGTAKEMIQNLDELELEVLNKKMDFKGKNKYKNNKPVFNYWISLADNNDYSFLCFILECQQIDIDLNEADGNGVTALQETYMNSKFTAYRSIIKRELFRNGYKLTNQDIIFFESTVESKKEKEEVLFRLNCYDKLVSKRLIDKIDYAINVLLTIESAKKGRIIGFGFDNWIAFANNAIHSYKTHWEYIEIAFKKFGLFDKLVDLDKKGTFQAKLEKFYLDIPKQDFSIDRVVKELYSELFD